MASSLAKKIRYVKDRCVNAYWMLREGKFKLIVKSVLVEINHRIGKIRHWIYDTKELDDSQVPYSSYNNKRKVTPASNRPTASRLASPPFVLIEKDTIATQIQDIIAGIKIRDPDAK